MTSHTLPPILPILISPPNIARILPTNPRVTASQSNPCNFPQTYSPTSTMTRRDNKAYTNKQINKKILRYGWGRPHFLSLFRFRRFRSFAFGFRTRKRRRRDSECKSFYAIFTQANPIAHFSRLRLLGRRRRRRLERAAFRPRRFVGDRRVSHVLQVSRTKFSLPLRRVSSLSPRR